MPTIAQFNTDVTNVLNDSAPLNSIAPSAIAGLFVELSGIVNGVATIPGPAGSNGTNGAAGSNGTNGTNGQSAYLLWVGNGGVGTISQFLASLVGATGPAGAAVNGTNGTNGLSAYQIWVANGNAGTVTQYLASLVGGQGPAGVATNGTNGTNGQSAYQLWLSNGNAGTLTQFLSSLNGTNGTNGAAGTNGTNGTNGLSVYQVWTGNGNAGTVPQFLASLVGTNGTNGAAGTNGTNGTNGLSAYQVWTGNGNVGTVTQFLASLIGTNGTNGAAGTNGTNGLSAYQVWTGNGNVGTVTQFLTSLNGTNGTNGTNGVGTNGSNGSNGINGLNFLTISGIPAAGAGNNGDSAMDYTTGTTYLKTGGTWTSTGSLKGATGTGAAGTNGTNGTNGSNGANFLSTNGVPAAGVGNNGDSGVDFNTGLLYSKSAGAWTNTGTVKGIQGIQGIQGNAGGAGTNGFNFSSGTGAATGGNTGDSYIDRATGQLWTKASGTWVQNGNVTGPTGPAGTYAGGANVSQALVWSGAAYGPRQIDSSDLTSNTPMTGSFGTTAAINAGTTLNWDTARSSIFNDSGGSITNFAVRAGMTFKMTNGINGTTMFTVDGAGSGVFMGNLTANNGSLIINNPTANPTFYYRIAGVNKFINWNDNTNQYFDLFSSGSVQFRLNGTTNMMTLDSAGNGLFGGSVTTNGTTLSRIALQVAGVAAAAMTAQSSNLIFDNSNPGSYVWRNNAVATNMTLDTNGNLSIAGTLSIAGGLTTAVVTQTKYFTINVNGTSVKVLCG